MKSTELSSAGPSVPSSSGVTAIVGHTLFTMGSRMSTASSSRTYSGRR